MKSNIVGGVFAMRSCQDESSDLGDTGSGSAQDWRVFAEHRFLLHSTSGEAGEAMLVWYV